MALTKKRKQLICLSVVLILACGFFVATLGSTYTSPNSRLWSSSLGYPNFLRNFKKPIPVTVVRAERRNMVRTITADGTVEYINEVPINVELPGIVSFLGADLGDKVRAGQVLLRINSGGYKSRVAKLSVELERNKFLEAKNVYDREQKVFDKGLISRADLELRRRAYEEQEIIYQKAVEDYENADVSRSLSVSDKDRDRERDLQGPTAILSPSDGTIIMKNIALGENLVRAKESAMKIGDRLVFMANFDQRYIDWIKEGQKLMIHLSAFPGKQFSGEVFKIDQRVFVKKAEERNAPSRNTFSVLTQFANHEKNLSYGMNGYCVIKQSFSSLAVPESALMRYSGKEGMVMVANSEGKIELRPVTYSLSLDGWVAVLTGLEGGETIVTSGQIGLEVGDAVTFKGK